MVMFRRKESGAVSLFIVVFAMLLITIVTLSFLRLMLRDQSQASTGDLSQSAYDSALAGTEDAKRALIYYRTTCGTGDTSACDTVRNTINSSTCNQGLVDVIEPSSLSANGVQVQQSQSTGDSALNQAYTCVLMQLDTPSYVATLSPNSSRLVPLLSTSDYTTIKLEWYTTEDLGKTSGSVNLEPKSPVSTDTTTGNVIRPLLSQNSWPSTRPPMLRAQLMQFGASPASTFKLTDFDNAQSNGTSGSNTIFLYPLGTTGSNAAVTPDTWNFSRDARKVPVGAPVGTSCVGQISGGGYACTANITLPTALGNNPGDNSRVAYLRLTSLYKSTHFRVTMVGTNFKAVQPIVDSTGRANDQYRRTQTYIDLYDTNFPFPEAAVDVSGNICKNFLVTEDVNSFSTECNP